MIFREKMDYFLDISSSKKLKFPRCRKFSIIRSRGCATRFRDFSPRLIPRAIRQVGISSDDATSRVIAAALKIYRPNHNVASTVCNPRFLSYLFISFEVFEIVPSSRISKKDAGKIWTRFETGRGKKKNLLTFIGCLINKRGRNKAQRRRT